MVIIYYPEREVTDPTDVADALSENLSDARYGTWGGNFAPALDSGKVLSRLRSITIAGCGAGSEGLWFVLNTPQDMSAMIRFAFAISSTGMFGTGPASMFLIFTDTAGRLATASFGIPDDGQWYAKQFAKTDFVTEAGFDWTQVKRWSWYWQFFGCPTTGQVWVDAGPFFTIQVEPPQLTVTATDTQGTPVTGKSVQLSNAQGFSQTYALPLGPVAVSPAGDYSLTILNADFVRWTDGVTTKTRTVTLQYSGNYVFTAQFSGSTQVCPCGGTYPNCNPCPPDLTLWLAVGGVAVAGLAGLYYFTGRRKRGRK